MALALPGTVPTAAASSLSRLVWVALDGRLDAPAALSVARLQARVDLLDSVAVYLDRQGWSVPPPFPAQRRLALIALAVGRNLQWQFFEEAGRMGAEAAIDADGLGKALAAVDSESVLLNRYEANTIRAASLRSTWQHFTRSAAPDPPSAAPSLADGALSIEALMRQVAACLAETRALDAMAGGAPPDRVFAPLDEALTLDPEQPFLWVARGSLHLDRGDLPAAAADFTRALALDPLDLRALINRGIAQRGLDRPAAAMADYQRALDIAPADARLHVNIGNLHADAGRLTEAMVCYDRALVLAQDSAEAHFNRGRVRCDLGRFQEAIDDLTRALALQPGYRKARLKRAAILEQRGDVEGAIDDYSAAIETGPPQFEWHLKRGGLYERTGALGDAHRDFQRAVTLAPERFEGYHRRGRDNGMLGRDREELQDYAAALERGGGAAVYIDRGWARGAKGAMNLAMEDFQQALALAPDNVQALVGRGMVAHEARRFGQAVADYSRAISLCPDDPDGYLNRGRIHALQGRWEAACQDGKMACERGDCSAWRLARRRGYCP